MKRISLLGSILFTKNDSGFRAEASRNDTLFFKLRHYSLLILLVLAFALPMYAQTGASGLAFLKDGVGGRALAMGEAYSAIADDPSAMYYNPAALTLSDRPQLMFMHRQWIQDTQTEYVAGQTSADGFSFGGSLNSTSINNIEVRDVPGPAIGTFDAHNMALGLSVAYAFDSTISVGISANYLYEKIYYAEASGGGYSFGAMYLSPWNIRFGAALDNVGSMGALGDSASTLPTAVRVGAGEEFGLESITSRLTVAAELVSFTVEKRSHLHTGAELEFQNTFAVRAGYEMGYDSKSFSAGVGIKFNFLRFDYAFVPFTNDLGTTHTLSLEFTL